MSEIPGSPQSPGGSGRDERLCLELRASSSATVPAWGLRLRGQLRFARSAALMVALATAAPTATASEIAADAGAVRPLLVGAQAPAEIALLTEQGSATTLRQAMAGRAALVIFHRGGWCPYCDLQLAELRAIEPKLREMGCNVIAITPDAPASLRRRAAKDPLGYTLLSDQHLETIQAFGIAFRVDQAKLGAQAANVSPVLPVPAVFIVDAKGVIRFQHVNPDYRVLVPNELLLAAAKASLASGN